MNWFVGRAGYALFDVWSIVHFCFWVFVGSNTWALKIPRWPTVLACMCLALLWEVFERHAEEKWPELWLTPESWWNAWVSDPLTCVLGLTFVWYALDNWRV